MLEKALRYLGYDVTRAMNITDVGHLSSDADTGEDKMLKGARREHKTVMQIAQFYTDAFFSDCEKLGIKRPEIVVPATSCIDTFIHMVEVLLEKGYAYIAGGNVYFDTSKLENYYVFGNMEEESLAVGVRDSVEEDENKRSKSDFVLWFTKSKFDDQELKWDSPWGVGYPGWHIECSGISIKYLGEYLDIHCGGIDNALPHHTKGDFLTVSLLEEKGYAPLVYRMFCLQSHYRKPLTFSFESLDNTATAYKKLVSRIAALKNEGEHDEAAIAPLRVSFRAALENDLNTSLALTALYDVLKAKLSDVDKLALIKEFDEVLSLGLLKAAKALREEQNAQKSAVPEGMTAEEAAEIEALIAKRTEARKAKDWATADAIRDALAARHIVVKDTPQGITWSVQG